MRRLLIAHVQGAQAGRYTFAVGNQQSEATLTVKGEAQLCRMRGQPVTGSNLTPSPRKRLKFLVRESWVRSLVSGPPVCFVPVRRGGEFPTLSPDFHLWALPALGRPAPRPL